jgi:GT2 family glycosyltransferase
MDPSVWIVVVNWNQRVMTLECLASLAKVTYTPYRTLLVDNGSSDGSAEAVRAAFPAVEVLPLPRNRLFAGGNNAGIQHALTAGADMVMLLNNDTLIDPACVGHLVAGMKANSAIGMTVPKIFYAVEPARLWYAGGRVSFATGSMSHRGIRELDHGQFDQPGETEYATGCCLLVTRGVIERIGLLDETYKMYAEDADWSLRAREAGYRIQYVPAARVWHRLSVSTGGHLSWYKLSHKAKSNARFFLRHAAWYQVPGLLILGPLSNLVAAVRYVARPRGEE